MDDLHMDVEAVRDVIVAALRDAKLNAWQRSDVSLDDGLVLNVEGVELFVCVSIQPEWDPQQPGERLDELAATSGTAEEVAE